MVGPAWQYILIRGLYTDKVNKSRKAFFTPVKTFAMFIIISFGIEFAQYYNLYDVTCDPLDFAAYISILLPLFLIDYFRQPK